MCGSVLVEILFNYPGVGYVLYNALRTADYFVMQGVIMFIIFTNSICNFFYCIKRVIHSYTCSRYF